MEKQRDKAARKAQRKLARQEPNAEGDPENPDLQNSSDEPTDESPQVTE